MVDGGDTGVGFVEVIDKMAIIWNHDFGKVSLGTKLKKLNFSMYWSIQGVFICNLGHI